MANVRFFFLRIVVSLPVTSLLPVSAMLWAGAPAPTPLPPRLSSPLRTRLWTTVCGRVMPPSSRTRPRLARLISVTSADAWTRTRVICLSVVGTWISWYVFLRIPSHLPWTGCLSLNDGLDWIANNCYRRLARLLPSPTKLVSVGNG